MRFSNIQLAYIVNSSVITPLDLPLDSAILGSQFILKSVEGLGPPDVNIAISNTLYSGGVYQGRQPQNRQLVFKIGYQPDFGKNKTVGDLRSELYRFLTPKFGLPVTISIQNDVRTTIARTQGYVKSIDPDIFSEEPEVQIAIDCLSPYLMNWGQSHPNPASLPKNPLTVTNIGDAPSGFYMQLTLTAATGDFSFFDGYLDRIRFIYPFEVGDIIRFDTTPGKRAAYRIRDGVTISLLPYQHGNSKWLQLTGGANILIPSTQSIAISALIVNANYWGV